MPFSRFRPLNSLPIWPDQIVTGLEADPRSHAQPSQALHADQPLVNIPRPTITCVACGLVVDTDALPLDARVRGELWTCPACISRFLFERHQANSPPLTNADADALAAARSNCTCPACLAAAGQPCLLERQAAPAPKQPFYPPPPPLLERREDGSTHAFPTIPPDLYRIREAARLTGITEKTIRQWIRTGKIATWGRPMMFHVSLAEILPRRVKTGADPSSTCWLRFHKPQVSAPSI